MNDRDLDAIRARADAATKGPWDEEWRAIPDCPGYEVSDHGNVRSYYRKGNHKTKRTEHPRTLARRTGRNGYPGVSLPNGTGSYSNRSIHRLVMECFVGPCPEGMEVAHLNGDRSDARRVNLAYVTHRENESHKVAHGTTGTGERNSNAVLLGWQVAEIKYLATKSVPQGKIANLFNISHKQVHSILAGQTWESEPARQDVPALLAEIDRLNVLLADMTDEHHDDILTRYATLEDDHGITPDSSEGRAYFTGYQDGLGQIERQKAEAWDEGHRTGWEHCQDGNYGTDHWDDDTPNPYGTLAPPDPPGSAV